MSHSCRVVLLAALLACSSSKPPASPDVSEAAAAGAPDEAPPSEPAAGGAGPSDAPEGVVTETLFVRDALAECQGEGSGQCLQVRNAPDEQWRHLYAPIEGFEYEAGHAYELRVEATRVANAPADAASIRYRLVEVVSKQKTEP